MRSPISCQPVRTAGFSLVEMLVVVLIISVLVGIALTAMSSARQTATATATKELMSTLNTALISYDRSFRDVPASDATIYESAANDSFGLQPSDFADWLGGEVFAQAILGPRNDDGREGFGFRANNGRHYGPYLDMKRSEGSTLHKRVPGTDAAQANGRWTILQPSTLTNQPILYFRALPEKPDPMNPMLSTGLTGNFGDASKAILGQYGKFNTKHNDRSSSNQLFDRTAVEDFWNDMATADPDDPRLETFQIALRASRYMLYAAGPDDVFGTADDVFDTYR